MSLFKSLVQAVRSWRRRRAGAKTPKRSGIALERLDHRQLLSVNFTGNVTTDFPESMRPGVVVLREDPQHPAAHPLIPPALQPIIKVSGFDINGMRLSYDPSTDILSIGIAQPDSQRGNGLPVLAGDADNNGNSATVNPAITAMPQFRNFQDFADFGGPETMGVFLNLSPAAKSSADVVAGFSNDVPSLQKTYQVADADVLPGVAIPAFGTPRPQNTGGFFTFNNPNTPAFELSISHFSQLFLEKTGQPLTADSQISIGAFGGSSEGGITEAFFPPQTIRVGDATPPQHVCPPASPPILINPHQARHVNTAHPEKVKVLVLGSSGFPVSQIVAPTVRLGGAAPVDENFRDENHDGQLDVVFTFIGDQIHLPPGFTNATVTGMTADGNTFSSSQVIFNRDLSFYTPAQIAQQRARQAARGMAAEQVAVAKPAANGLTGPKVSIPRRANAGPTVKIPGVGHAAPTVRIPTAGQRSSSSTMGHAGMAS